MNRSQIRTSLGPAYAMKSDREIDRIVLAVLEGVREPSEGMEDAAEAAHDDYEAETGKPLGRHEVFRAMIDALIAQVREGE